MRLIFAFTALAVTISCDLDMYGTYTFTNAVSYQISSDDSDTVSLLEEYFTSVLDMDEAVAFKGTQTEAFAYGQELFLERASNFDNNYIQSLLDEEGEWVQYILYITGNNMYTFVASLTWAYDGSEDDNDDDDITGGDLADGGSGNE